MNISLIIPVLNEAENVPLLWQRLADVVQPMAPHLFEVVFVDDGSSDGTPECIEALKPAGNLSWKLLRLSRNFGHQAAISAGMKHAQGEAIIFLDADLQDPPELIPVFLEKFAAGYDVVYGIRQNRKEPLWLRLCFTAFYRVFNSVAQRPMPRDAGDFGLVSKRVARLIAEMPEYDRLIRGMRSWVGFKQIGIPYNRPERHAGTTSYSLGRRIEGALDGIFGYSRLPIRFALFTGSVVCIIAGVYLALAYISAIFAGATSVPGWKSLITLGFLVAGANIIATAIVGEYVCRIYFQGKMRPLYVIEEIKTSHTNSLKQPDFSFKQEKPG